MPLQPEYPASPQPEYLQYAPPPQQLHYHVDPEDYSRGAPESAMAMDEFYRNLETILPQDAIKYSPGNSDS